MLCLFSCENDEMLFCPCNPLLSGTTKAAASSLLAGSEKKLSQRGRVEMLEMAGIQLFVLGVMVDLLVYCV